MISIISLLALIMYSHVVVSQYTLKEVRGSTSKMLVYQKGTETLEIGTIEVGDCLQVRDDSTDPARIIFGVKWDGVGWSGSARRSGRFDDTTIAADLGRIGYPMLRRSVWLATPPATGKCKDPIDSYVYQRPLIEHAIRVRGAVAGSKKTKKTKKTRKAKLKGLFVKEKYAEPLRVIVEWEFRTAKSGEKTLLHVDQDTHQVVCSLVRGESIVLQAKGVDYELYKCHLKRDGKWDVSIRGGEHDDDDVCKFIAEEQHKAPDHLELWLKKLDGTKELVFRSTASSTGTATAAADAYVEYEDEMDGFASKYDELLDQFEYDVEIEAAREKKAMTHLAKEKYKILRAKNRENEYW